MDALFKFLKVFNSGQKPWQVTLAIVLGMATGFVPVAGLQGALIFLIALIINVPLAIYFFFAAQFALLSYLMDPMFESIGYSLLHANMLQGMWTELYNIGFFRLLNFDNTIVLGSMVFSTLFAFPLYYLVKKILVIYRERIAEFFARFTFLSKLGIFTVSDEVIKTLRVWGFALFTVIMILIAAFVFIFMDSLFKKGIESGLGAVLNKEVVIKDLNIDLNEASLTIAGLEIQNSDAKTSMMYIDEISADIDFNALLMHKTHIDHITMKGMTFNQKQQGLGAASNEADNTASSASSASTSAATASANTSTTASADTANDTPSSINLPNIDTVLQSEDLKSSKLAQTAKSEYATISAKWDNVIKKEFGPDFRNSFTADLNAIKAQAKDIKKIADTKRKVDAFNTKVKTSQARILVLKKEFSADKNLLQKRIVQIQKAKDEDFKALKSKYSFDKGGAINVIGIFFGDKIKGYLDTANEYYEKVAPYLKSDEAPQPTPKERHSGRWIKFKEERPSPSLLIKKIDIDGTLRTQKFQGLVTDITNDQQALGKTTKLKITSHGDEINNLLILGEENHLVKPFVTSLNYSAKKVRDMAFDLAFISLKKSDMGFKGSMKVVDGTLSNKTRLDFINSDLKVKGIEGKLGKGLQADLKKTKNFTVDINAKGKLASPEIDVRSSLEAVVTNSLKRMMRAEVEKFEKQLNSQLSKMVGKDLGEMDLSKLSGIDKALSSEDKALNSAKSDAQKSVDAAVKKSSPKIDTKKLQKMFKF